MTALKELIKTAKKFGFLAATTDLLNRIFYKLAITHIERIYIICDIPIAPDFYTEVLSPEKISALHKQGEIQCENEQIDAVEAGDLICIGAFSGNQLCGFTWYAVYAYRYGGTMFAYFHPDFLCGFGAFVHPDYRGRGVRDAIVAKAVSHAHSLGRKGVIAAITWTNFASLRSAIRIGYQPIGLSYRCAWLPHHKHQAYYHLRTLETLTPITVAFVSTRVSPVLELLYRKSSLLLVVDAGAQTSNQTRLKDRILLRRPPQSVSDWAKARGVACVSFSAKAQHLAAAAIRDSRADFLISYTAPLFGEEILQAPRTAAINIHPSLLPDYRGGSPLPWQALREEACTGATLHLLTMKIDQGAILAQYQTALPKGLSQNAIFALARNNAARVLDQWLDEYSAHKSLSGKPQPAQSNTPFARNITLADINEDIDWHRDSAGKLFALARYLERWPSELLPPPGIGRWFPWQASRFNELSNSQSELDWRYTPTSLTLSNASGQVILRPVLNPWRLLGHWRNWRRLVRERGKNIYL